MGMAFFYIFFSPCQRGKKKLNISLFLKVLKYVFLTLVSHSFSQYNIFILSKTYCMLKIHIGNFPICIFSIQYVLDKIKILYWLKLWLTNVRKTYLTTFKNKLMLSFFYPL